MKKEKSGYITVYLALLLGVLLSFVFTILEAVRVQTIRTQTEGTMDVGLFSIFGEFHRELLEQYDIFAIDTTYGEGKPDICKSEEHLQYYLNQNFENDKKNSFYNFRDLTNLHCDNVDFEAYMRTSDEEGQVLKRQIVEYMQEKKGIAWVETGVEHLLKLQEQGKLSRDVEREWNSANETVHSMVEERKKEFIDEETGEPMDIDIDNPSDHVKQIQAQGILGLAMPQGKKVSGTTISSGNYFSHREKLRGTGTLVQSENLVDKVTGRKLLQEYLFEKCSSFQNTKEKALLKYQIEYLLHGKDSDLKNLEKVIKDILHIREVINITYLFSDTQKVKAADDLAWIVSLILFTPELKEAVKISILYAWSYAESVKDVRILLDGNKVPLSKSKESWNTPLSQLINFTSYLDEYKVADNGMSYKDYLNFFLHIKPEKEILYRFMDVCEMDIRMSEGNNFFQMDGCIQAVKATVNVSSGYGPGYKITRTFAYE